VAILDKIYNAVYEGKYNEVGLYLKDALNDGIPFNKIINDSLSKALIDVGDKFGKGELYMPDMLLSAKAMKHAMEMLKPLIKNDKHLVEKGVIVIGSVKGDLHDIGKNLVITLAEGQGYRMIDLGIDVDYDKFVEATKKYKPQIVAFSGLLTTTLANVPNHIKALDEAGLRKKVILAVGGAPVTREFADRYGVEIYAADASSGVKEFIKYTDTK
jgi:5-methyltetrahydrofolate--homocysteine methyltransferase